MPRSKPKRRHHKPSRTPQYLILGGVILLVVLVLSIKPDRQPSNALATGNEDLPAAQLDQALAENKPTLAFFHSDNCYQCIVMMDIVAQVYPEFENAVTLVDINVYDERNDELLRRVGLQYIPTLIFYNLAGNGQVSVGVMEAENLRQTLSALAGGE
jgi:thiol:disulfide interchange protein